MTIAFDVDYTLINRDNSFNEEVLELLLWFIRNGDKVVVWSGGGVSYATKWVDKLKALSADDTQLDIEVIPKLKRVAKEYDVDIAVDDEFVTLGKVNIKITNFTKVDGLSSNSQFYKERV